MRLRKGVPTDLQILEAIYKEHYEEYAAYSKGSGNRSTKIYVPVNIDKIADNLNVDEDIVFGRLYYHLEHKYAYKQDDGSSVHFFSLKIGTNMHCVNFPLMASVLADLQDQSRKHNVAIWIAGGALFVSLVSVAISILSILAKK